MPGSHGLVPKQRYKRDSVEEVFAQLVLCLQTTQCGEQAIEGERVVSVEYPQRPQESELRYCRFHNRDAKTDFQLIIFRQDVLTV